MYNILIVDDDSALHFVYQELFGKNKDYSLIMAKNGIAALEKMASNKINLIITDIKMPEMNGIELIQQVRKIDKNMPIIVCTAFQYMKDDYELVNANLAAYVTKPFKNDQFRELVRNILARTAV
ncbi:MAG: response regulator [bacterium]|nr:response regulator [bacterium]